MIIQNATWGRNVLASLFDIIGSTNPDPKRQALNSVEFFFMTVDIKREPGTTMMARPEQN